MLRYESLGDEFTAFVARIGQSAINLPWHGRSTRSRHYSDYFTQSARRRVELEFAEDLDMFGYTYE